jgi:hypothetical protein
VKEADLRHRRRRTVDLGESSVQTIRRRDEPIAEATSAAELVEMERESTAGGIIMVLNRMAGFWARTALVWFVLAMLFGMCIGMSQQFGLSSPHAHAGLLGWVSSALFAFLYALTGGEEAPRRGPYLHWVAHNIGALTMVTGLFLTIQWGPASWTALIPAGGAIVILATLWLAVTLWPRLGRG